MYHNLKFTVIENKNQKVVLKNQTKDQTEAFINKKLKMYNQPKIRINGNEAYDISITHDDTKTVINQLPKVLKQLNLRLVVSKHNMTTIYNGRYYSKNQKSASSMV